MERVLVIRDNITLVIQGPMNTHMGSLRRGILNIPYYSKFVKNIVVSSWKQNSKDVKMSKRFMREHLVKHVDDEEKVRKVLGKEIEWLGAHPEGKYPDYSGWYVRDISGHKELKIMLGTPNS